MFKKIDNFTKNLIIVFIGTSFANIFNLLYQLLIAHKLSPDDFAAFNSLLSIFMLLSIPTGTISLAITRYTARFRAQEQRGKIKVFLSKVLKKNLVCSLFTFFIFYFFSFHITYALKIYSIWPGYILTVMMSLAWIIPVFSGGLQGMELFGWMASVSITTGIVKLILAFIFIILGFNIGGVLSAFYFLV
jgi:O-antigen/teichoic acid export membrane protein